ncbi:MAG: glycosyltransferase family 9 protein, partial [Planctomycetota bacterium]|nr:glycosyltransferase family 9 protein [Planctomycetota bacterium]
PKKWLKSPSRVWELRQRLREQSFDVSFDTQGLTKSAIAAWLSGARIRIGFTRGEAREIAPLLNNRLIRPDGRHVVRMALSLLSGIGDNPPDVPEFVLPPCPAEDAARIDLLLARPEYAPGFVLLGPWGTFRSKLWPAERFLELAVRIRGKTGLISLMLGHGEYERRTVRELACGSGGALDLAPELTLAGVAELARRASLFVGGDSFPLHIASAVGCRALGLYGITDPLRLGPLPPNGESVYEWLTLIKSPRKRRRMEPDNMLALGVDKVFGRCLDMLARHHKE